MAETPEERLARLRRELEATAPPPASTPAAPTAAASGGAPAAPMRGTGERPQGRADATTPPRPRRAAAAQAPGGAGDRPAEDDGWSLAEALGGASLGTWVALGLVVIGGYLLLAQLFPGLALPGSMIMAAAGVVLLWLHFTHRAGAWGLYAGALLAAVGSLRVIADLLPIRVNGETALGVGLAFSAIAVLRQSQAGGYGWQGMVGVAALGLGGLQFALGLLPGAPGVLDLVVPALILGAGVVLLLRTIGPRDA